LCGACRTACPVDINLPDLLLALRARAKESGAARKLSESVAMRAVAFAARRPTLFAFGGKVMRGFARLWAKDEKIKNIPVPPLNGWTRYRDLPVPQGASFRERWKKDRHD